MGTGRNFHCASCNATEWVGNLFEVLYAWAKGNGPPQCAECSVPYELRLDFAFAFGADGGTRVVAVFLPGKETTWQTEQKHTIRFYPFLVIGEVVATGTRTAWLPYWHTDEFNGRTLRKYGQWAPHMDLVLFADLVEQARAQGHLTPAAESAPLTEA